MLNVHVFLGPSLALNAAKDIAPHAYFHPPAQCGDIIRLFRLNPKLIVIIDGLYETTPAIWHKEILLAMQMGIEVWGAASMGALRAAELHQYGMHGFGRIFQEFKTGNLNDDDEVAVLHLDESQSFSAVNDAMVNIRATCDHALKEGLLTHTAKENIVHYCKKQFYPYRLLAKALQHLSKEDQQTYLAFSEWLNQHGVIDVKQQDALTVLQQAAQYKATNPQPISTQQTNTLTHFLRELVLFANTTPFKRQEPWLPPIEQNIHTLHQQSPLEYMLFAEIVCLQQKLMMFALQQQQEMDNEKLLDYIDTQGLYKPEQDFAYYKTHTLLSPLYDTICQAICLGNLTSHHIEQKLPVLAHYYDLPQETMQEQKKLLGLIYVLIFSINQHLLNKNYQISKGYLTHHLKQIKDWRKYTKSEFKEWLAAPRIGRPAFIAMLHTYLTAYSMQSLTITKMNYYHWIHDAYAMVYE